ncbi:MAG: hypothetical protein ACXIT4_09935 [Erythrobacter sp.]
MDKGQLKRLPAGNKSPIITQRQGKGQAMREGNAALLASLMAVLAACNSDPSGSFTTAEGQSAEYRIDTVTGETSMTITTPDGSTSLRSGSAVPVELPAGFALYPDSRVISSTVVNQPDGLGAMVVFETPAQGPLVIAHFREQAEQAGFRVELEAAMSGTVMLAGKRAKDGTTFIVNTSPYEDGRTMAQLVIGNDGGR